MKSRNVILAGLLLGLSPIPLFAQKVGTTSMQFLKVKPCARATAVGDAYSVWATGAEALFWNPGGLATAGSQEFSMTYVDWILDTRQAALSYALPLGDFGVMGAQLQFVDYGAMEETSNDPQYMVPPFWGLTGRTFRPFSYLVGLTYSRYLTDRFSIGLSAKYAHESLFNGRRVTAMLRGGSFGEVKTWTDGLLFDFGVRYNTDFRSVQIGAVVENFGADVRYASEASPVPLLFRLGIAADVVGANALVVSGEENNRLGVALDLFQPNDYAQQAHLGVEFEHAGTFALRAGYKFNYDYEGFTAGGGVKQVLGSVKFSLDYSYGSIGTYLGSVQRISLGAILL
jgi:hypothetical protein